MNWETHVQSNKLQEIDQLGLELNLAIDCTVHFPAYGKNLFECKCGVVFPLYLVKGQNWEAIADKHIEERKLIKA